MWRVENNRAESGTSKESMSGAKAGEGRQRGPSGISSTGMRVRVRIPFRDFFARVMSDSKWFDSEPDSSAPHYATLA